MSADQSSATGVAEVPGDVVTAVARRARYLLFARAFAYPTEEGRREVETEVMPALEATATGDDELDRGLAHTARSLLTEPLEARRDSYGYVFTHIEPQDYPPYESAYLPGDVFRQTNLMADVAAFYRAHGLVVGGAMRERPDHVATELEFMAFMAHKEAYALTHLGDDEVAECRRTQEKFLADHLGTWAPGFAARLATFATRPFFRSVGEQLAGWLALDLELLDVTPEHNLTEPQPQPPPDDACGACEIFEPGREL